MAYCSDEIYQVILSVSPFNYKGKLAVLFYCERTVYWNWNQICLSFKKISISNDKYFYRAC